MTLIISSEGKDFVIVGADCRGVIQERSSGTRVELNNEEKILDVTKHVCVLISGDGDIGNQLIEDFKQVKLKDKNIDGATKIAKEFSKFCRKELSEFPEIRHEVDFIVAGLNKEGRKYNKPCSHILEGEKNFFPGLRKNYAIAGKPMIPHYIFSRNGYRRNMSIREMCELVAQTIYDTKRVDGDVGGDIRIVRIKHTGIEPMKSSDVKKLVKEWEIEHLEEIIIE